VAAVSLELLMELIFPNTRKTDRTSVKVEVKTWGFKTDQ